MGTNYYFFRDLTPEEQAARAKAVDDDWKAWEKEAAAARDLGVRVVTARTGIALGAGGGALATLVTGAPPGASLAPLDRAPRTPR